MIKNIKALLLVSLSIVACSSDDSNDSMTEAAATPGSAVFSKYVALEILLQLDTVMVLYSYKGNKARTLIY